jgi:nitrate/nitrite transporter NarK
MGNLGGFFGPYLKVWAETRFASPRAGLYLLAALTVFNAALVALLNVSRARAMASNQQ